MYLNFLQLKAARHALNLGVRDIGDLIETSRTTISKLENNIIKIENMRLAHRRNIILHEFFKKKGITFPNEKSISFSHPNNISQQDSSSHTLTRFQLRVARVILNKTQKELACLANISPYIIEHAELFPNKHFIKTKDDMTIHNLLNLFAKHQIHFPDSFSISF
jgi:transcriptional regulator with XRE-family HTH domain